MPLSIAPLDTRRFDELLEEARALIPRVAPAWTDHNYHDPGITLIELFAWLVESDFYRLDRTPDANIRAFLRLSGIAAREASVAESVLVVRSSGAAAVTLPAGLQVGDASNGVVFQTAEPVFVSQASLVALLAGAAGAPDDYTDDARAGRAIPALGPTPAAGAALYLAFDRPFATAAAELSLHLRVGVAADDREMGRRIRQEYQDAHLDLVRDGASAATSPVRDWRRHHSARTTWEYSAAGGTWAPLAAVVDETRALTLSGFVRATAPLDCVALAGAGTPAALAGRYVIRCRLTGGAHDCPPTLRGVALNAVRARHERDVVDGGTPYRCTGHAGQRLELRDVPVVPGSTRLTMLAGGVSEGAWSEVAEWDRVGPHDRAYRLDAATGAIEFGDGRAGRVPPAGALVSVTYRTGGGEAGNVPAGTLRELMRGAHNEALVAGWLALRPTLDVEQPDAADGGEPRESLALARARAVEALAATDRAVTLADFEALALSVPGTVVARAFAIAGMHPDHPGITVAGAVTVVVIPLYPDRRPVPDDALLAEVARYLCRRRTLTTEVHVTGPCYKQVTVTATLHASAADRARLARESVAALDAFLHPLHGGPEGTGWPVGRAVHRTEVMAVLGALDGVAYVDEVTLQVDARDAARCGNAEICPRGLVTPGTHRITIAERNGP